MKDKERNISLPLKKIFNPQKKASKRKRKELEKLHKQPENNEQNVNKHIHINNYFNVNGLNAPTKIHRWAE